MYVALYVHLCTSKQHPPCLQQEVRMPRVWFQWSTTTLPWFGSFSIEFSLSKTHRSAWLSLPRYSPMETQRFKQWATYRWRWWSRDDSSAFSRAAAQVSSWWLQLTDLSSKMRRPKQNIDPISSSSLVPNCRPCQLNKALNSEYRMETEWRQSEIKRKDTWT